MEWGMRNGATQNNWKEKIIGLVKYWLRRVDRGNLQLPTLDEDCESIKNDIPSCMRGKNHKTVETASPRYINIERQRMEKQCDRRHLTFFKTRKKN
jgi:hypothetical protein